MKTFEEQFPSLKGKGLWSLDTNCLTREDGVFIREDIIKHCIDKKKVKEAIEKEFDRCNGKSMSCPNIFKDLGMGE